MIKKVLLTTTLFILFLVNQIEAQKVYELMLTESELSLEGTSTMHDWHMKSHDFSCTTTIDFDALNNKQITNVYFKGLAEKVLSDKKLMDKKAHKAMKIDEFPEITFVYDTLRYFTKSEDQFSGEIVGLLTLAGQTKPVNISFNGVLKSDTQFSISGEVPLKMTDFGMEPPAFMFGAVKTGDDIILKFQFSFKSVN